jgi:hypothetical protein
MCTLRKEVRMVKNMKVKFDCISGKSRRYTLGKAGDSISGAVYIQEGFDVPSTLVLELEERRGDDTCTSKS